MLIRNLLVFLKAGDWRVDERVQGYKENYKGGVVIGDEESSLLFRALGFKMLIATNESEVLGHLKDIAKEGKYALAIVMKHVIKNEENVRSEAKKLGISILVLPTRKAPSKPIDINILIAKALGFG